MSTFRFVAESDSELESEPESESESESDDDDEDDEDDADEEDASAASMSIASTFPTASSSELDSSFSEDDVPYDACLLLLFLALRLAGATCCIGSAAIAHRVSLNE